MIRSLTRALAGLAAVIGLAAPLPQAAVAEELNLFAWSEYVPQSVLDGFTKETGIQVNYETYASNEEMLAKLLSGAASYDLIQPSEYTIEALVKENQLQKLDHSKLPNLKNIGKQYYGYPHDPKLEYSIPYMQGTVGIVINTEKVKEPVAGFGINMVSGITLPEAAPARVAKIENCTLAEGFLFVSGQVPKEGGEIKFVGKVGREYDLKQAQAAARLSALNMLAHMRAFLGDLDRVERVMKLTGYVNAVPDFTEIPHVVNGASELFIDIFGDAGRHARTAVGVAVMPFDVAIEVEGIFLVR